MRLRRDVDYNAKKRMPNRTLVPTIYALQIYILDR